MTYKRGDYVASHMWATEKMENSVDESQIQPNGVDVTVKDIQYFDSPSALCDGEYNKPDLVSMRKSADTYKDGEFIVPNGAFLVRYSEAVEIPKGSVGFVWPRSRLLRCGLRLVSAVWDSGYVGSGYGLLIVSVPTKIEDGMGIGQMVFADADKSKRSYEGTHQGENLEDYVAQD